ncbi:hypothetical protein [Pseudodesulfovibrio senegalensis]|uniref:Uncharacterized protein n=1 Tax=Pseudodesulfovibrio senegalensis TaxID=1721087 RepID=A0A6N6N0V0_9BACT|nr:hypothetical protein [Pseudodesulfovibrio senegalensis]KAB1440873.1 hypothetical protein F8A88_13075 [Pseudodesulfovibrio senegalensis]
MGVISGPVRLLHTTALLVLLCAWALPCRANLLLLHSDSAGSPAAACVLQGMQQALDAHGVHTDILQYHLGADRNDSEEHFDDMAEALARLLKEHPIQGVTCDGDAALAVLQRYRASLFGTIPATFCNVDHFEPRMGRDGNCTGLTTEPGVAPLLETMLALHPEARTVVVFTDHTPESYEIRHAAQEVFSRHMDRMQLVLPGFEAGREAGLDKKQVVRIARNMPADGLVLLARLTRDGNGSFIDQPELARTMAASCPVPVYVLHEADMAAGTAGGYVTNEKEQGRMAAQALLALMQGHSLSEFPVTSLPRQWRFHKAPLQKAGADLAALPPNALVDGKQQQTATTWFPLPPGMAALGGVLIGLLAVLLMRKRPRNRQ